MKRYGFGLFVYNFNVLIFAVRLILFISPHSVLVSRKYSMKSFFLWEFWGVWCKSKLRFKPNTHTTSRLPLASLERNWPKNLLSPLVRIRHWTMWILTVSIYFKSIKVLQNANCLRFLKKIFYIWTLSHA